MAVTSLNLNPMSQFSLATLLFSATKRETFKEEKIFTGLHLD